MSDELMKHAADVQAWFAEKRVEKQLDSVGQGLVKELQKWLLAGRIEVEATNGAHFAMIEKNYPISVNRTDWSKVNHCRVAQFRQSFATQVDIDELRVALGEFRETLAVWLNDLGISKSDYVVYVGDDSDIALRMSVETFLECFPIVFEQPQHGYVLPDDGHWCLNYTMESELFLGKSSDAIAKGWIDE